MFLGVGIYALFVSTNYWERFYTLVPSAVALGVAIVPLWASMGNYITRYGWVPGGERCWGSRRLGGSRDNPVLSMFRMAQKYYEYSHFKEREEQGPKQRPPRGSHAPYLLVFQAIFYSCFHVRAQAPQTHNPPAPRPHVVPHGTSIIPSQSSALSRSSLVPTHASRSHTCVPSPV